MDRDYHIHQFPVLGIRLAVLDLLGVAIPLAAMEGNVSSRLYE